LLASKLKSELILEYIFEEEVLDKIDNISSGAVTSQSLEDMAEEVKEVEMNGESTVIFNNIEHLARNKNIEFEKSVHTGIHSEEILDCITEKRINLMITEFHKDAWLKYRIFYDSPVPIWLEHSGKKLDKIYGILTNLSYNKLVPKAAFKLSKKLNLPLHFYYVLDSTDEFDEVLEEKKRKKLKLKLNSIQKKFGKDFKYELVNNEISGFINDTFKHKDSALVILGRFTKPIKLPFLNLDKKIEVSKKLEANVLLLK
jgi:hypothetical protein